MFTEKDFDDFVNRGITQDKIDWQLGVFNDGVPGIELNRAATVGDGIINLSEGEVDALIARYDKNDKVTKLKFVPASGAASRMFKALFEYYDNAAAGKTDTTEFIDKFISGIRDFAFYEDLHDKLKKQGKNLEELLNSKSYAEIIGALLMDDGLGYGNLPKGLLKFHTYSDSSRTPFEEHISEGINYAVDKEKKVKLHFTVSPEHQLGFESLLARVQSDLEEKFGVKIEVIFSVQKTSTDTMAVDMKNQPFRENDGSILFRPGGHGALIDNLNELEADIIFIKNIDNVVPERHNKTTLRYKKALAGKLLEVREKIFSLLCELENAKLTVSRIAEIYAIIKSQFCYEPHEVPDFQDIDQAKLLLRKILNRPIRVCGVVKNLGEPGGGPFWAKNSLGDVSLQIVESSQVDQANADQVKIFSSATHFNPVDLVCSVYDVYHNKYNLKRYIDHSTCFISEKSKDGKTLKALELPGLWNGAMADWLTLFVEVPVETFNPVKTVNDLLRPMHQ